MATLVNGNALTHDAFALSAQAQADFYAKLSNLESQILTGQHPQYKFDKADIAKLALSRDQVTQKAVSQNAASFKRNATEATVNGNANNYPIPPQHPTPKPTQKSNGSVSVTARTSFAPKPSGSKPAVPQIDPVLLTKSASLVQAELSLKRQRIEKILKESATAKKRRLPDRELDVLSGPNTFDAAEVLEKAHANVKPFVLSPHDEAVGDQSGSSLDDGYYSSRGNSWSPDQSMPESVTTVVEAESKGEPAKAQTVAEELQSNILSSILQAELHKTHVSGASSEQSSSQSSAVQAPLPRTQIIIDDSEYSGNAETDVVDILGSRDESYSPPAAGVVGGFISTQGRSPASKQPPLTSFANGLMFNRERESESYSPPPAGVNSVTDFGIAGNAHNTTESMDRNKKLKTSSGKKKKSKKEKEPKLTRKQAKAAKAAEAAKNTMVISPLQRGKRKRRYGNDDEEDERQREDPNWRPLRPRQPVESTSTRLPMKYEAPSPVSVDDNVGVEPPRRLVLRPDGRAEIEVHVPSAASEPHGYQRQQRRNVASNRSPASRFVDPVPLTNHDLEGPPSSARRRTERNAAADHFESHAPTPLVRQLLPYPEDEVTYMAAANRMAGDHIVTHRSISRDQHAVRRAPSIARSVLDEEVYSREDNQVTLRQNMPPPPQRRMFTDEHGNDYFIVPVEKPKPPPKPRRFVDADGNEFIAIPTKPPKPVKPRRFVDADGNEFIAFPTKPSLSAVEYDEPTGYLEDIPRYTRDEYDEPSVRPQVSRAQSYARAGENIERGRASSVTSVRGRPLVRASSQAVMTAPVRRAEPQIIDLTDDDDADYRRMPPPPAPARIPVRKRRIEAVEEPEQLSLPYKAPRAASLRAMPHIRSQLAPVQQRNVSAAEWLDGASDYETDRMYAARSGVRPVHEEQYERYAGSRERMPGRGEEWRPL